MVGPQFAREIQDLCAKRVARPKGLALRQLALKIGKHRRVMNGCNFRPCLQTDMASTDGFERMHGRFVTAANRPGRAETVRDVS
jgi:hypothetical protein